MDPSPIISFRFHCDYRSWAANKISRRLYLISCCKDKSHDCSKSMLIVFLIYLMILIPSIAFSHWSNLAIPSTATTRLEALLYFVCSFAESRPLTAPPLLALRDVGSKHQPTHAPFRCRSNAFMGHRMGCDHINFPPSVRLPSTKYKHEH